MRHEKALTHYEALCLFSLVLLYNMFNDILSQLTVYAGTAAWMAQIIGVVLSFALLGLFLLLYRKYEGMDLPEIFDAACGKPLGRFLSIILCVYIILYITVSLNHMVKILQTYAFSGLSSLAVYLLVMASAAVFAVYSVNGLARVVSVFLPFILAAWLIVLLAAYRQYDPDLLNPILGYGAGYTVNAGGRLLSQFGGILILGVFAGAFGGKREYARAALKAIAGAAVIFTVTALCYNMAVPYRSAAGLPAGVLGIAQST
ncbi:MAG: spore germination protein, partial [Oscillospiraceae bacterium]|nr:spore germination protein [Oscillospiraceae bacterium]